MSLHVLQEAGHAIVDRAATAAAWSTLWSRATAQWPDTGIDADTFAAHVAERLDPTVALLEQLESLHAEDLLLCAACLRGDARALRAFERSYSGVMERAAQGPGGMETADVVQTMRQRLFVGETPRIASYKGTGPLKRWLKVACQRLAIDFQRRAGTSLAFDDGRMADALDGDLHEDLLKHEYRAAFRAAFEVAMQGLDAKARNLLRLHLLHDVGIDELAQMNNVHRATAARWLAQARDEVRVATRDGLAAELGAQHSELDSIMDLIRSRLDVTITRHLRT